MDVFYEKDDVVVYRSKLSDVERLCNRLRKSDVDEIWSSHNVSPFRALKRGLVNSVICLTISVDGIPEAMFGIVPDLMIGDKASIWFLSSDKIFSYRTKFLRQNKKFIEMFLRFYPYLYNYVDVRNIKSIAWIKWLGGKIETPKEFGIENKMFHYFYFERDYV